MQPSLPPELTGIDPERLERFERAKQLRPWRYYAPVTKLRDGFHMSKAPIRLVVGPNRGSKSTAGAAELIMFSTGYNHFRDETYPTPNICWASTLDHVNLGPVQQERVIEMAPHGSRFYGKDKLLVLPKPWESKIYFKVCEAGWEKYQGQGCLAIWQDEEWPDEEGLKIFKEMMRRRNPAWDLKLFMTLTPLSGYTWSYDYLYKDSKRRFKGVEVFEFSLYDCLIKNGGFYTEEQVAQMDANLDPFERQARIYGQYAMMSGSPAFEPSLIMAALERGLPEMYFSIKGTFNNVAASVLEPDPTGNLVLLTKPEANHEYIMGVDPAMGVYRDRSACSVWDRTQAVEVAYYCSNAAEPAAFARDVIMPLGNYYNNALVVVENNSHAGGATLTYLQGKYGNLYMQQEYNTKERKFTHKYGWRTDLHSRGLMIATIKECLRMTNFLPSKDLLREAMNMIVDKDGKIDHVDGKNDDHLMAGAIALTVARMNPSIPLGDWTKYRESYSGENAWMGN